MQNVKFKRGDTVSIGALWRSGGTPVDLTDITITSQVRPTADDVTVTLTFTITKADQTTNPGEYTLGADAATTALLTPGNYVCDVQYVEDVGGVTRSTETFSVVVLPDVTRAEE